MKRRTFFGVIGAVLGAAWAKPVKAKAAYSDGLPLPPAAEAELRVLIAKWKRSAVSQFRSAEHEPGDATTSTSSALKHGGMCYFNSAMELEEMLSRGKV